MPEDVNPRYAAYAKSQGRTVDQQRKHEKQNRNLYEFMFWVDRHLTAFAKLHGFEADLSCSRGVVVRTWKEAERLALAKMGHEAFTTYLEEQAEREAQKA